MRVGAIAITEGTASLDRDELIKLWTELHDPYVKFCGSGPFTLPRDTPMQTVADWVCGVTGTEVLPEVFTSAMAGSSRIVSHSATADIIKSLSAKTPRVAATPTISVTGRPEVIRRAK